MLDDLKLSETEFPPPSVLDEGEYQLRITSADFVLSKKGSEMIRVVLAPEDSTANEIFHYLMLPDPKTKESDPRTYIRRGRRILEFMKAFGIPTDCTISELKHTIGNYIGSTAWALVGVEAAPDGTTSNTVRRFLAS